MNLWDHICVSCQGYLSYIRVIWDYSKWRPSEVVHVRPDRDITCKAHVILLYVTKLWGHPCELCKEYFAWDPFEIIVYYPERSWLWVTSLLFCHTHNGSFHIATLRGHACKLWEGHPTWKSYKIIPPEGLVAPSMWVMWETFYVRLILHMKALQGDSCRLRGASYRIIPHVGSCEDQSVRDKYVTVQHKSP
jgi:hypothetical protein